MIVDVLIIAAAALCALWYLRDSKQVRRDIADADSADAHRRALAANHPTTYRRCPTCHGTRDVPTLDESYRRCPECNP
jgi:hypothetical protein